MIEKVYFKKKKKNLSFIDEDLYSIESVVKKGLVYVLEGNQVAMITTDGMIRCDQKEVGEIIGELKPPIAEELMEIVNDIPELRRLRII